MVSFSYLLYAVSVKNMVIPFTVTRGSSERHQRIVKLFPCSQQSGHSWLEGPMSRISLMFCTDMKGCYRLLLAMHIAKTIDDRRQKPIFPSILFTFNILVKWPQACEFFLKNALYSTL